MCDSAWYGMLGCGMNMLCLRLTWQSEMVCDVQYIVCNWWWDQWNQFLLAKGQPSRTVSNLTIHLNSSHTCLMFFSKLLLGYLLAAILYASKFGQLKAKTLFDLGLLHGTGRSEKGWSKGGSTSLFFALTSITGWVTCRILSDYTHPTVLRQFRLCWEYKLGFTGYHLPHLLT